MLPSNPPATTSAPSSTAPSRGSSTPGEAERDLGRVVVLGATGYVGARLVPRLAASGKTVVAVSRSPSDIEAWEWGDAVDIIEADLSDPRGAAVFDAGDTIVHLVHSMTGSDQEFSELDLTIPRNVAAAAAKSNARRIVYLSGLGGDDEELSDHLASRQAVGAALRGADVEGSGARDDGELVIRHRSLNCGPPCCSDRVVHRSRCSARSPRCHRSCRCRER